MSHLEYPEEDPGPVVAPLSVEGARREFGWARAEIDWMRANLSGCDWCCGGGERDFAAWVSRAEQAKAWLEARGESCPELADTCGTCGYADVVPGKWDCKKCETYNPYKEDE